MDSILIIKRINEKKRENERNFTDKMNCKKMKEILLTEKEMVLLVLLYFRVCMYVIFIIL